MSTNESESKQRKLHQYPYLWGLVSLAVISAIAQTLVVLDCFFPVFTFEVDAVSSVMSTCSEVIAGLYGITLTGYIFFADRFQDTSKEDETLYDVVQSLLLRYNHMAGFISLMCLVCIVLGEGIVLYGGNDTLPGWLYRLWVDETLLLFFWNFNFILYFVISVLDPQKVSRISAQKKAKLSGDKTVGDAQEFMADWHAIEELLFTLQRKLTEQVRGLPPQAGSKPELVRVLDTLRNYGRISNGLWQKLHKLRQYYNLTIHDPHTAVSGEMCRLAEDLLAELQKKAGDTGRRS